MAKRSLTKNHLIENHPAAPNINLGIDQWIVFETLWRQIPVGSCSLRSEVHFGLIFRHDFTKSKIRQFYYSIREKNVLRFKVIMDDFHGLGI